MSKEKFDHTEVVITEKTECIEIHGHIVEYSMKILALNAVTQISHLFITGSQ